MKPEDLLEAMNDARDEYVEDMMALMRAPVPLRRKKPLLRTVLLAAALSCLLPIKRAVAIDPAIVLKGE